MERWADTQISANHHVTREKPQTCHEAWKPYRDLKIKWNTNVQNYTNKSQTSSDFVLDTKFYSILDP